MPVAIKNIVGLKLENEAHKGEWFLCWLGRVIHNSNTGTREVDIWLVPVHRSKLKYKNKKPVYDSSEALGKIPIKRVVGIGDLSFLLIGMIISNQGNIVAYPQDYSNEFRTFSIDDVQSVNYCKKYLHNTILHGKNANAYNTQLNIEERQLKTYANYPFPYVANGSPCFTFNQDGVSIIIPKFEIARFSLFSSSKIVNAIFSYTLDELFWVDKNELLSISEHKKMIVAKGINKVEAATLANIAFVKEAQNSAKYIFNSVQYLYDLLDINDEDAAIFFNSNFIFNGNAKIYVLGREVEYQGEIIFLVYEILDTDNKLPYKSVQYDFYIDNRSAENKNDPALESKQYENNRMILLPEDIDTTNIDIKNQPDSNTGTFNLELKSGRVNYFNTEQPQVEPNDKIFQEYLYKGVTTVIGKKMQTLSTKDANSDISNVGRVNITNKSRTGEGEGDYFETFFSLIDKLEEIFNVNYIQAQGFSKNKKISQFPIDTTYKPSIIDHIDFCFYNPYDQVKKLRRVAVVELSIENMFFYIIEIDPYGLGNTGLRTAIIFTVNLDSISTNSYPNKLSRLLRQTVIYEGNFSRMHEEGVFLKEGLNSERSNHKLGEALNVYAQKQVSKIVSIIKKANRLIPLKLENYIDSKPI